MFEFRMEMVMRCVTCGQPIIGQAADEERREAQIVGTAKYGTCPKCGRCTQHKKDDPEWIEKIDNYKDEKQL